MINKLQFSIDIKAEKSKIWETLWIDQSYRDWASVFFEGSYLVCDNWEEGSKVLFLAPDQSGIYSRIEKHIPNEVILFKHIGKVINGKEQAMDKETEKWTGATEKYALSQKDESITLSIEIDVMDEHLDFMKEKLPMALEKIKNNCG